MDNSKLRALDWNPRSIDETIADTIAWIKANGD
jgi:nucleoside-diphosphate-sugar epimerase